MIVTKCYAHGSKESMYEIGEKIGLTGQALDMFMYALYEVEFTLDVDPATGEAEIVEVNGRKLERTAS